MNKMAPVEASQMNKTLVWISALCFAAFPLLRPYSSEVGLDAAAAWASWRWVASHLFGTLAFVSLGFARVGLGRLYALGVAAILPYFGAETFGLQALGRQAEVSGDVAMITLAGEVRYGVTQMVLFGIGLVLIAVAAALWAWRSERRVALWVAALLLAAYLPQFLLPAWGRMAHGVALAVALILVTVPARLQRGH